MYLILSQHHLINSSFLYFLISLTLYPTLIPLYITPILYYHNPNLLLFSIIFEVLPINTNFILLIHITTFFILPSPYLINCLFLLYTCLSIYPIFYLIIPFYSLKNPVSRTLFYNYSILTQASKIYLKFVLDSLHLPKIPFKVMAN